jgi:hypothetical protein
MPCSVAAPSGKFPVKHVQVQALTRSIADIRKGDCLQIKSTIVDTADLGRVEMGGSKNDVHDMRVAGSLDWRYLVIVKAEAAFAVGQKCSECSEPLRFKMR